MLAGGLGQDKWADRDADQAHGGVVQGSRGAPGRRVRRLLVGWCRPGDTQICEAPKILPWVGATTRSMDSVLGPTRLERLGPVGFAGAHILRLRRTGRGQGVGESFLVTIDGRFRCVEDRRQDSEEYPGRRGGE